MCKCGHREYDHVTEFADGVTPNGSCWKCNCQKYEDDPLFDRIGDYYTIGGMGDDR